MVSTVYVQNSVETTELLSFIENKTTVTTIPRIKPTKQLTNFRHLDTSALSRFIDFYWKNHCKGVPNSKLNPDFISLLKTLSDLQIPKAMEIQELIA